MSKHESLELSIKANCMRILEILEDKDLEDLAVQPKWSNKMQNAVELKQRMAQLRKDTLKAEKIIYPKREY